MMLGEVIALEEKDQMEQPAEQGYVPRPAWQVWGARVAAVLFAGLIVLQIVSIARGGL